jgi:hypothetical protein
MADPRADARVSHVIVPQVRSSMPSCPPTDCAARRSLRSLASAPLDSCPCPTAYAPHPPRRLPTLTHACATTQASCCTPTGQLMHTHDVREPCATAHRPPATMVSGLCVAASHPDRPLRVAPGPRIRRAWPQALGGCSHRHHQAVHGGLWRRLRPLLVGWMDGHAQPARRRGGVLAALDHCDALRRSFR